MRTPRLAVAFVAGLLSTAAIGSAESADPKAAPSVLTGSLVGFVYDFVVGYALGRLLAPRQRVARATQRRTHHLAIDGARWGKTLGGLFAAIPFLATNALVYKGGDTVGPFLERLSIYFPGYHVSFAGSFVALLYAFVLGYLGGRLIAGIYNTLVASKG